MIALQILSKIISTGDNTIVEDNLLTDEYFVGYEEEFNFIENHVKEYGNVPDKATFLAKFPELELVEVSESDEYLLDAVREEYLYYKSVPVVQKVAELLKTDSNAAAEYMLTAVKELQPQYGLTGVNIIAQSQLRFEELLERQEHPERQFFTTGFPELDDVIHGIQRAEELIVIFARTNQGKSWILEKMCTHVWQIGYNVGYISPEMSALNIGYRFDTLNAHYSNTALGWGKKDFDNDDYQNYINSLSSVENKFIVSTPADFGKKITVKKIQNWVTQYKLDLVAIDGITYMSDERYKRGDNKTTSLTNISEDLMELSMELNVPVLVVVQANRGGVVEKGSDDTPELETIRDSDGIAHNASKVIALNQREHGILNMTIKKQRTGAVGATLSYNWDIDTGEFTFLDSGGEVSHASMPIRHKREDETDVF